MCGRKNKRVDGRGGYHRSMYRSASLIEQLMNVKKYLTIEYSSEICFKNNLRKCCHHVGGRTDPLVDKEHM